MMPRLLIIATLAALACTGTATAQTDPVAVAQENGRRAAAFNVASSCGAEPGFYPSSAYDISSLGGSDLSRARSARNTAIDWHNCRIGYFNAYVARSNAIGSVADEATDAYWTRKYMKETISAQRSQMVDFNKRLDAYADAIADRKAELRRSGDSSTRRTTSRPAAGPTKADEFFAREQKRKQCVYNANAYPEPDRSYRISACNQAY